MPQSLQRTDEWQPFDAAAAQVITTRKTENTRKAYQRDWQKWRQFARENGVDPRIPGLAAAAAFRDWLQTSYSANSVSRILSTIAFLYAAFRDAGMLKVNPFTRAWLPRPEKSEVHKTPAIEDEIAWKLLDFPLDTPEDKRDAAILYLLYNTGARRASVASLRRVQFVTDGRGGFLVRIIGKGQKVQTIKLTEETVEALSKWGAVVPPSPYVFPNYRFPDKHINLATVNKILNKRADAIGETGIHPHRFRAAFITAAYDAGVYEPGIQAAAGHASPTTTKGYDRGVRGEDVFDQVAEYRRQRKAVKQS